jgi:hypothetical protein
MFGMSRRRDVQTLKADEILDLFGVHTPCPCPQKLHTCPQKLFLL